MPDDPTSDDPKKESKSSETKSARNRAKNTEKVADEVSSEEIVDDILREQAADEVVNAEVETPSSGEEFPDSAAEESPEDSPLELVGEMLRSARLAKKYSTADIARELMITQTFVDAIENGVEENLPSRVYVRGYVASYAEYVEAPKDDVLDLFDRSPEELKPQNSKRPASISGIRRRNNVKNFFSKNSPKILTALIIATILGISGVIWYFWSSDAAVAPPALPAIPNAGLEQPVQLEQATTEVPEAIEPEIVLSEDLDDDVDLDENDSEVIAIGDADFVEENPFEGLEIPEDTETSFGTVRSILMHDDTLEEMGGTEISGESPSTPPLNEEETTTQEEAATDEEATTESEEESSVETALALSENEAKLQRAREEGLPIGSLLIELKEECWIEVDDRYGDRVYNELHQPNDTVLLSAVAPLQVTLGNAKGATMYYNGDKVVLRPSVVTGVAQVNLR